MLRRFDSVSSISYRMVERLIKKGVPKERTRFFPNWVNISHINPRRDGAAYRAQLGIAPDAVVALYSGTLGAKQGLMLIPAAAALLAHGRDIVFVICGDGVMKTQLTLESEGMPNIRLLVLQPLERSGDLLCMADIHLLPQSDDAAHLVLPSKLSAMLASGRPVVSTCRPGTELETVVSQCGLVVPPGNPAALADAIVSLVDDPQARLHLGLCARAWAEAHVEREVILRRIFGPLDDIEHAHKLQADTNLRSEDGPHGGSDNDAADHRVVRVEEPSALA